MKAGSKPAHLFYAHFLQNLRYNENYNIGLAGVSFSPTNSYGIFHVNPKNACNLTLKEFAGLVVHEICHIIFFHLHAAEMKNPRLKQLFNIAADCQVNQIAIDDGYDLPGGVGVFTDNPTKEVYPMLPERVAEDLGVPCPELDRDWQYYLDWILGILEENKENTEKASWIEDVLNDLEDQTDHEDWESDELTSEELAVVSQLVAQATKEALENAEGQAPGSINLAIQGLVKRLEGKLNWGRYLAQFFGRCGEPEAYTRRRFNKKDLLGTLGLVPSIRIGVVLDTSGSVRDKDFGRALGEIVRLSQLYGIDILVQETSADCTTPTWKLSEVGIQDMYTRNGYGGTNMRPGIDMFLSEGENQVSGIIVISDGELGTNSSITPEECYLPLLWVFTENVNPFKGLRVAGETIYMKE